VIASATTHLTPDSGTQSLVDDEHQEIDLEDELSQGQGRYRVFDESDDEAIATAGTVALTIKAHTNKSKPKVAGSVANDSSASNREGELIQYKQQEFEIKHLIKIYFGNSTYSG
jgi:hypothetical protein